MMGRLARPAGSEEISWLWLGHCPVCGTSVLVDDEFVRIDGTVHHAECVLYRLGVPLR
jgi:hypothetical protein